jgi:enoyl-CoA hydratase/carnithine racemase
MDHVRLDRQGAIATITLQRDKVNALNHALLRELESAIGEAESDAAVGAVILTSDRVRFFSPGFDVAEVFAYNRDEIAAFLGTFGRVMDALMWMPKPTIAALNGQTYAGGALLALCTDFRLMADGPYGFALTEVNIGVRLPESVFRMLEQAVGVPVAKRMFLTGEPISAADGYRHGLYHATPPEAELTAQALNLATQLAAKPRATYAAVKHKMLSACGLVRLEPGAKWLDVEAWFTPEAQAMKAKLAEKLGKKT